MPAAYRGVRVVMAVHNAWTDRTKRHAHETKAANRLNLPAIQDIALPRTNFAIRSHSAQMKAMKGQRGLPVLRLDVPRWMIIVGFARTVVIDKWAATSVAAGCRYTLLKVSPGGTLYPLGLTPTTAHKYPVGSEVDDLFEGCNANGLSASVSCLQWRLRLRLLRPL